MNEIQMASKMLDAREMLQRLFPEDYPAKVANFVVILKGAQKKLGLDTIPALLELSKEASDIGKIWFLAAAVEIIEAP